MKTNGKRYCKVCGNRLIKKGETATNRQRWYCGNCKKSLVLKREDVIHRNSAKTFKNWILKQSTKSELKLHSSSFRKSSRYHWDNPPVIPKCTGEVHNIVVIDGIWLKARKRSENQVCLIGRNLTNPIGLEWTKYESSKTWEHFLCNFEAPKYVVCDGQNGMLVTINTLWPHTKVQRCLFHIYKNLISKLTRHPETDAAKWLLALFKMIFYIKNIEQKEWWVATFKWLLNKYNMFLSEKTYYDNDNVDHKRQWWYTHKRVRSADRQIDKLLDVGSLFTYLENPLVPRTSNLVEGGINSQIRTLLKCHRGMSLEHRKKWLSILPVY